MKSSFLNSCWMASCYRDARAFAVQAARLQHAQEEVLLRIIRRNRKCWFGTIYGFRHIRSVDDFRRQVPLSTYDGFRPAIDRIRAGEQRVLTCEPVLLLEPTSGTSAEEKLIPFTTSLRREFQVALRAWIHDLFRQRPAVSRGRAYWSISPLAHAPRKTAAGIPIGFADDTAYLGRWEQSIVRRTLAVPPEVALIADVNASRMATLCFLLQSQDLSLISVWSPTFLIQLLGYLQHEADRLCTCIERGKFNFAGTVGADFATRHLKPNVARAAFLRDVFQSSNQVQEWVRRIWPRLALVSSWADGASATYAAGLQKLLPHVEIQPKGLLATEGFVSLPLIGQSAPALAYRSHFFEFLPSGEGKTQANETLLAHELQVGSQYEVVVTTGGGLYRYRMFDQVEVVGHHCQVPLLRFLGRANTASDLVGEKLTESQAASAIQSTLYELDLHPSFISLIPIPGPPARYAVSLAMPHQELTVESMATLAKRMDELLQEHSSYRYARELGQLQMIDIQIESPSQAGGWAAYESACIRDGQSLGDIKAPAISNIKRS